MSDALRRAAIARARKSEIDRATAGSANADTVLHAAWALGLRYAVNRYPSKCSQCQIKLSANVGYVVKYVDLKVVSKTKWTKLCTSVSCARAYLFPIDR